MRQLTFFILSCCFLSSPIWGQVRIVGSDCVLAGSTCQYKIQARFDSTLTNLSICVTGGRLINGASCNTDGSRPNSILVVWDSSVTKRIELQSTQGNIVLPVMTASAIGGGYIYAENLFVLSDTAMHVYTFRCSEPSGGSCTPAYTYQWQESTDGLNWKDISNSTSKDLMYSKSFQTNLYFRRMVTDVDSNTSAYSDIGQLIYVKQ